jgi:uncharacterized protein (DUF934 family)
LASADLSTSAVIALNFPITIDGQTISELTMRRPKVGDNLRAKRAKGDEADKAIALMTLLVDLAPEQFSELDETDFDQVQEQYLAFTGRTATNEN